MKRVLSFLAFLSLGFLLVGLYFDFVESPRKDLFYGLGTVSLFLVTMPLFLYWRKDKTSLKKYRYNTTVKKEEKE